MTESSKRIFGLDLLRAFAILGVVIGHGLPLLGPAETEFPWIPLGDGVDMFFVLSGYLIGGILIKDFVIDGKLGLRDLGHFLKRRWFRTLPNYYLVLGLNVLFAWLGWNMGNLDFFNFKFLWFGQNLAWPMQGFFWESWSLAIEEWFYLLFPVFFLLLSLISQKQEHRKWLFLAASLLFLILPTLLRITHFTETIDRYQWDIVVRKVVIRRMDAIAYGLVSVWVARYYPTIWKNMRWPLLIIGLALFWAMDHFRQPVTTAYAQIWMFSLSSLAYAFWLPFLSQWKTAPKWLMLPIRHVSLISYSLYLVHLGLGFEVIYTWFPPETAFMAWLTFGGFICASILVSTVLYYVFEKPMMNLRDRF